MGKKTTVFANEPYLQICVCVRLWGAVHGFTMVCILPLDTHASNNHTRNKGFVDSDTSEWTRGMIFEPFLDGCPLKGETVLRSARILKQCLCDWTN